MKTISALAILAATILFPTTALSAEGATDRPEWYQIMGGILAIPTTLIGLAYSYVLIRKTRIESRKLELEIREKEIALKDDPTVSELEHREIMGAAIRESLVASILLRFVLMYVVLQLWGMVAGIFGSLVTGAYVGLQAFGLLAEFRQAPTLIVFALTQIPQTVTWALILTLGTPLFRDIAGYLGVRGLGIFSRRGR